MKSEKFKDGNWTQWNGGECPVPKGTMIDVRYRDGHVEENIAAMGRPVDGVRSATWWSHSNLDSDIVFYRLHEEEAEDEGEFSFPGYETLCWVLSDALVQAGCGKGKDRHANGRPFDEQPIITIQRLVGRGFALGQAIKKIEESQRMDYEPSRAELLGAIVFIAGAIVHMDDQEDAE